jgi:hypothetical protein
MSAKEIVKEFSDRHFGKSDLAVSPAKIKEDKAYLMRVIRTGIELESASILRYEALGQALGEDGDYNNLNHLAQRVYQDGSISPSGAEVVFKGNSECWDSYHKKLAETETKIKSFCTRGARVNNHTTSAHITILTAQDRELPKTYLANYYQLYRQFCDALLWLTGANYEGTGICRSGLKNYAQPLMMHSPLVSEMKQIYQVQGSHYCGMFLKHEGNRFLENGNPNGILVEFRFVDRILSPSALTSVKCLLQAMLFKAVELSEFGILNIEAGAESWAKTKSMVVRIADGEILSDADKAYLSEKSMRLIDFIYANLRAFDGKSVSVLRKLAEKPISLRYKSGDSDEKIEKDLYPIEKSEFKTERELRRIIQLQLVKADGAGEWGKKVAETLDISERMVRHSLAKLAEDYNVSFDGKIGTYILVG